MDFINIANNLALLDIVESNIGKNKFKELREYFNIFIEKELSLIDEHFVEYFD